MFWSIFCFVFRTTVAHTIISRVSWFYCGTSAYECWFGCSNGCLRSHGSGEVLSSRSRSSETAEAPLLAARGVTRCRTKTFRGCRVEGGVRPLRKNMFWPLRCDELHNTRAQHELSHAGCACHAIMRVAPNERKKRNEP